MLSTLPLWDRLSLGVLLLALITIAIVLWVRTAPAKASDLYSTTLPPMAEVVRDVDGINAVRGADMLVVYTPDAGRTTTGTNQWGSEAVVENGRVVSVGGNNQPIPQNGFVVSAHGEAIPWLQANLPLGAKVELAGRRITATVDNQTHLLAAQRSVAATSQQLDDSWDLIPSEEREQSSILLEQAESALADQHFAEAIRLASEARYLAIPSFPVEVRGVWHRPVETTPNDVGATLDRLKDAGFNALFLETFYTGYTIYPSALAPQNPQFLGWDPLKVWSEEAAKRGIELHLWVHLFHLGKVTIDRKPLWTNLQRDGSLGATLEPGLYYGDPGHPEVRQYVFDVLKEMVQGYSITGLHLDYVRYPTTNDLSNTSGYSPASRQLFRESFGHDPMEISPTTHPEVWAQWLAWQEQNITGFVQRIHDWVRAEHPELILSAAVVPDIDEAIRTKRQNWRAWVDAGWLQLVTPMIYSLDTGHVATRIHALKGNTGTAWFVPGIAPFMGMSAHQVIDQVTVSRRIGQPGVVMFALHSIDQDEMNAYKAGMYSSPAATPWNKRQAIGAFAEWVIDGMNRWVAEDILPSPTALELDRIAYAMNDWYEGDGAGTPPCAEWVEVLHEAKRDLEGPFYGQRSFWLQWQIGLMIDVLAWNTD